MLYAKLKGSKMATNKDEFEKIHGTLDKLDSRLDTVDITLTKQEMNLCEHMKRSDRAEQMIEMLSKELKHISNEEIKPVQKHVNMVQGAIKFIGVSATLIAILKGLGVI